LNIRFQIFITICVAVAIGLGVGVASFYWEFNQQGEVPAIWPPNWPTALVAVTAFLLASYFAARFLSRQQEDHERVHGELLAKLAETSASAAQYHADLEEKVSERTANLKEEIEERRRVARALNYRLEFEKHISEISTHFISLQKKDFGEGINWALQNISEFAGIDSAYVYLLSDDNEFFNLAHRWRSPFYPADAPGLERLPVKNLVMLAEAIKKNQPTIVPSVADLPAEASAIQKVLTEQGIKSVLNLPLYWEGSAIGFLGISMVRQERHWSDEEVSLLTIVGQIICSAILRKEAEIELAKHRSDLEVLIAARTEELISAKEAAEKASLAKSAFLSSMSHELRTPLNAVMGFAQLLQTNLTLDEQGRHFADRILGASDHLLQLIDQILDLSKIEAGAVTLSIVDIDPTELVQDCCAQLTPSTIAKNVSITTELPEQAGQPLVRADYTKLKQALIQVLDNAVKYNNDAGSVKVTGKFSKGYYRFIVTDSGPGISDERQATLFKPFSQATSKQGIISGSGIGLPITRKLLLMMGGRIGLDSTEGEGARFWIEVPLSQTKAASPPAETPSTDVKPNEEEDDFGLNTSAKNILYIEDNPSNMEFMRELFRLLPQLSMQEAQTAEIGFELIKKDVPDVIFMDINLPGMNGIEALASLRSQDETKDIPVIALSANAMPNDVKKGEEAGFNAYITKPVELGRVVDAINAAAPNKHN